LKSYKVINLHPDITLYVENNFPTYLIYYTSIVKASNSFKDASLFNGMSSVLPNIEGKYSGNNLPRTKLASVTVNGPPFL